MSNSITDISTLPHALCCGIMLQNEALSYTFLHGHDSVVSLPPLRDPFSFEDLLIEKTRGGGEQQWGKLTPSRRSKPACTGSFKDTEWECCVVKEGREGRTLVHYSPGFPEPHRLLEVRRRPVITAGLWVRQGEVSGGGSGPGGGVE